MLLSIPINDVQNDRVCQKDYCNDRHKYLKQFVYLMKCTMLNVFAKTDWMEKKRLISKTLHFSIGSKFNYFLFFSGDTALKMADHGHL